MFSVSFGSLGLNHALVGNGSKFVCHVCECVSLAVATASAFGGSIFIVFR